jgi:triacylglycerol lipase
MTATGDSFPERMDLVLHLLDQRPRADWKWKFEPQAEGHSAINAVALVNAALLTYSGRSDILTFLGDWGFAPDVRTLSKGDTQGFVARQNDIVILAFRGTEPTHAADWFSDIHFHHRELAPSVPGLVHGGFADALELVVGEMRSAIADLAGSGSPRLFVTGHSMGGALAVLAAALLQLEDRRSIAAVYTYGQPRVGDPTFSKAYDDVLGSVTFRYVNDFDIVPHLPPVQLPDPLSARAPSATAGLLSGIENAVQKMRDAGRPAVAVETFAHVGQLKLFLGDGSLTSDESEWEKRELSPSVSLANLFNDFPGALLADLGEVKHAEARILDHDPLNGYFRRLKALVPPSV